MYIINRVGFNDFEIIVAFLHLTVKIVIDMKYHGTRTHWVLVFSRKIFWPNIICYFLK